MFNNMVMTSKMKPKGAGLRYHRFSVPYTFSVSEYTNPFNSSSGLGLVTRLTAIVVKKLAIQEKEATMNACPIPLLMGYTGDIHPPFPSAMVRPWVMDML